MGALIGAWWICSQSAAQADIEKCMSMTSSLTERAENLGLEIKDKRSARTALKACQAAEKEASGSATVKTALAQAHIWIGNFETALIFLEQAIEESATARSLLISMCAAEVGSPGVKSKSCDLSAEFEVEDPDKAYPMAKTLLRRGEGEAGLMALARAAVAGSRPAFDDVSDHCLSFDSDRPDVPLSREPAIAALDTPFAAAIVCEASFLSTETDGPNWATFGWNYLSALMFFDDFTRISEVFVEVASSSDEATAARAIETAAYICNDLAGDPKDPNNEGGGVPEHEIDVERARPICEAAAYIWPDNGQLHYNLSRVYGMAGEDLDSYAAHEAAKALGYGLTSSFNPNDYSIPHLMAAFHHGDLSMIQEVLASYRNAQSVSIIMGDNVNLFMFGYLNSFVTQVREKETFECESKDVVFPAEATIGLRAMDMSMAFGMLERMFSPDGLERMGNDSIGLIMSVDADGSSGLLNDLGTGYWNGFSSTESGMRDGTLFIAKTKCGEDARPLVENMTAFINNRPMPHRDLFYLSRYDPNNKAKSFFDTCGRLLTSERASDSDQNAAVGCRCLTNVLRRNGWRDENFGTLAEDADLVSLMSRSTDDSAFGQAINSCGAKPLVERAIAER